MIVYSFFLNYNRGDDYDFIIDHSHCLKSTYKGFHPVIENPDGSFQILYAMTTSKKLKNMFMSTRNMNIFKYYKSEVSDSKFKDMKKNLHDIFLVKIDLIDKQDNENFVSSIPMCITHYEKNRINDESFIIEKLDNIFRTVDKLSLAEKNVFTKDFENLMKKFKFEESIDLLSFGGANDSDIEFYESDYFDAINKFSEGVILKTLEVFIDIYGNTLKES